MQTCIGTCIYGGDTFPSLAGSGGTFNTFFELSVGSPAGTKSILNSVIWKERTSKIAACADAAARASLLKPKSIILINRS